MKRKPAQCAEPRPTLLWIGVIVLLYGFAVTFAYSQSAPESREKELIKRSAPATNDSSEPIKQAVPAPTSFSMQRVVLSLAIVIAAIFFLRWLSRRMMGGAAGFRTTRAIQVLSRSMISPRQQFLLVQVGRRLVVVADSGNQMNSVCEITDPDEITALMAQVHDEKGASLTKSFGTLFGRAKESYSPPAESRDSARPEELNEQDDAETRQELSALAEKVRNISRQFQRT